MGCFLSSQAQSPFFDHLTVQNGLSQNSVLAITQDSQGFLWLATGHGLTRYDGSRCTVYTSNPDLQQTISNDYVVSLLCDSRQNLWVGTGAGLDRYRPETDDFQRVLSGMEVYCLYEDGLGYLWAGTSSGLYQWDRQQGGFRRFSANPQLAVRDIRAIFEDSRGFLWVGTTTGLMRMRRSGNAWQYDTFRHKEGDPASLSEDFVTAILEDDQHTLWLGTQDSSIDLYRPDAGTFSRAGNGVASRMGSNKFRVRQMIRDRTGRIWVGTQDGLLIFNPQTKEVTLCRNAPLDNKSLSHNSVYSVFEDKAGSVWVGTYFGGANVAYRHSTPFGLLQDSGRVGGLSNNIVSGITSDDKGGIWISTEGGGANLLDPHSGRVTVYKNRPGDPSSLSSNRVKCVYKDRDGNIWLGTNGGGLNMYISPRNGFRHHLDSSRGPSSTLTEIPSLLEDSRGRFWVAAMDGLKVFRRNKTVLIPAALPGLPPGMRGVSVKDVFEDREQRVWVGTVGGLFLLEKNATSFIPVKMLRSAYINCIQEGRDGTIWAGLYYGGLARLGGESAPVDVFTDLQGLPNNNVMSIQEDGDGNLWLGTGNGLSKLDIRTHAFQNFTTSDGLTRNEFNYRASFRSAEGKMYFGGYAGVVSFFPEKIEANDYVAPLVFTGLRLFNVPVDIRGKDGLLPRNIDLLRNVRLRYNQDVFTVDFALLNFVKPDKNTYAYKLDGLDKDWTETREPSVTYIHLPTGTYTLLVKGANNDGVWSRVASFGITVLPPFWRTWWAYTLYVILLAVVLFGITRFLFLRALLKKEEALHQVKLNFFTNISHEIRNHLTLITGPVERLLSSARQDARFSKQLLDVKKNTDRLLRLVNEQMDFRKAETGNLKLHMTRGNIVAFLESIYACFQNVSVTRHIKASFVSERDVEEVYFDREQLEKVFFNLLSNAYKFTPDGGSVGVFVRKTRSVVEVRVTDNGKGIAPENVDKIFTNYYQEDDKTTQNTGYGIGLALAKSIVELHKGTLTAESLDGKTTFTVTLPAGMASRDGFTLQETPPEVIRAITPDTGAVPAPEPDLSPPGAFTVLLVEDNPEVRAFIKDSLADKYRILESDNGLSGWGSATEDIPDAIVSDVMMPEMDGLTFCHRLKADPRTSHIPVILLTAKSSSENLVDGLEMGADVYLTKPFSIRVLELHLRNLLASRERMRQKFSHRFQERAEEAVQPNVTVAGKVDGQFLNQAIAVVEEFMDDPEFGVARFAVKMTMSPPVLYKKLKAVTGMSVNDFIKSLRLQKAHQLLLDKRADIQDVAYMVGYKDRKYFAKEYKKRFGERF